MKTVRLPVYDDNGYLTSEILIIDIEFFLSSTKGLRSNLVMLVDESEEICPDVTKQELENIDRLISGLSPTPIKTQNLVPEWRKLKNFPDYEISQYQDIRVIGMDYNIPREKGGRIDRIILYKDGRPTMMNVDFLYKKAFPELQP